MTAAEVFHQWFPASGIPAVQAPQMRLVLFHGAGSDRMIFISKNLGGKSAVSSNLLLEYCKENSVEVLALQLPGRTTRMKDAPVTSAQEAATKVFEILENNGKLESSIPVAMAAHSMGSLIMYELIRIMSKHGKRLPVSVCISCMVSPDTPVEKRPWKISSGLSDEELKDECRAWDSNEIIFEPDYWAQVVGTIRNDFKIFDEYQFPSESKENLRVNSLRLFSAKLDSRIRKPLMLGWRGLLLDCGSISEEPTSGEDDITELDGTHSFVYDPANRARWMQHITAELDKALLEEEYA
eukprot:GHVU01196087.1.p1 GENE.GHVU01196087.1~~GHVU01196087.1.p1  ORF type:complete len:296 (-),score=36.43 GHVU01196087.1:254-1141(-)